MAISPRYISKDELREERREDASPNESPQSDEQQ